MESSESNGAASVGNAARTAIKLIKESIPEEEHAHAIQELNGYMLRAMKEISIRFTHDVRRQGWGEKTQVASNPYITALEEFFPEQKMVIDKAKAEAEEHHRSDKWWQDQEIEASKRRVERLAREGERLRRETGGCYVATCVYGSYNCPQVWTLRRFRDYRLAKTWFGRVFIRVYYKISPILVGWFGKTMWFKQLCLPLLSRMVDNLQKQGFDGTPYQDIDW